MTATEVIANRAVTNVTSGGTTAPAGGTVETWTVVSSSGFPAAATGVTQFHIADVAQPTELIAVTNVSGTTWTVTRGDEGTTPVAHAASGFTVYLTVTAGFLNNALPAAQTFALANNTYKTLQAWTVTGQTDDPLPAFSLVAGSQTYGTSPAIQGPAAWWGYNAAHLSNAVPTSPHGAAGISFFADAGDSNNGAGGHGVEVNPACFLTADGSKATNALQMVAIDDNTNTVNTTIRCGSGTVNNITSNITFQNGDASKTFLTMRNATSDIAIGVPVIFTGATFTQSNAGAIAWTFQSTTSNAGLALMAAGSANPATMSVISAAGTGQFNVSGNNASTVHATISLQKSGVSKWTFEYADPTFLYILAPVAPSGIFALWEPAGTYATSLAIFFSQLQTYDSVICGNAALATSATTGFLYLPSCAGTPTGVPAAKTGTVPCLIDTAAGKLWANIGGTWKSVAFA